MEGTTSIRPGTRAAADRVDGDATRLSGRVRKAMHISPFLDEEFDYVIGLSTDCEEELRSDDRRRPAWRPMTWVLTTGLQVLRRRRRARRSLGKSLRLGHRSDPSGVGGHSCSGGAHLGEGRSSEKRHRPGSERRNRDNFDADRSTFCGAPRGAAVATHPSVPPRRQLRGAEIEPTHRGP